MTTPAPFLTAVEIEMFSRLPEDDIVELAAELDMLVGETLDRVAVLNHAVPAIAARVRREGLPLSRWDREDLEALHPEELAALARLAGARPTVDALLQRGSRAYRAWRKRRPRSQVPMVLPMLLAALARYARSTPGPSAP